MTRVKQMRREAAQKRIAVLVKSHFELKSGYMDVLDGLLHKYEQKNPVTTQEALKEVMRSVGKDIWEDVVRLTCQKYDLVTV